jgi:class 3 adenylate cyclase
VEYASLESGDSVVLVDDSADRVLSAARSLQQAVQRFQVPQNFRFGAAVGAISFSTTTQADGETVSVPGAAIVIRVAARIEPYATVGTILCTEEFVSELDETAKALFMPVESPLSEGPGLGFRENGMVVIRKNEQEEPIEVRLFQATLS